MSEMKICFRWYGEGQDTIPLAYIRQIPGVSGVVTSLLWKAAGDLWTVEECSNMRDIVNAAGLSMEVIESVNIHEDIKLGLSSRDKYIENYIITLENLSKVGVKVICYNFMPVLDWARSDLFYGLPDGSNTMFFDRQAVSTMTPRQLADKYARDCGGIALPGWEPERLQHIERTIEQYAGMNDDMLLSNAKYFLDAVIPAAKRVGISMAIHPDDPPFHIFGLPRILNSTESIRKFFALNTEKENGLTLCTGSLGADQGNDIPGIIREFADRIHFVHLRNLKFVDDNPNGNFYESAHPTSCGSLPIRDIASALIDTGFSGYLRPDHGRMIWDEKGRPGYGLYDRALGIAYIVGLFEGLSK